MISACGYLADDGIACSLHGRLGRTGGRPSPTSAANGRPKNKGLHPGCVFAPNTWARRGNVPVATVQGK